MDNYCSPQYVDFTTDLEDPLDDYFNKEHEIDKPKESIEIPKMDVTLFEDKKYVEEIVDGCMKDITEKTQESIIIEDVMKNITENIIEEAIQIIDDKIEGSMELECEHSIDGTSNDNQKLETEINVIKNTPIKIIYDSSSSSSNHGNIKRKVIKQVTYNDVMQEAIEALKNCVLTTPNVFKKPMPIKDEPSKFLISSDNNPIDCPSNEDVQILSPSINECKIILTPETNLPDNDISPINLLMQDELPQKLDSDKSDNFTKLLSNVDTPMDKNEPKLSMENKDIKRQSRRLSFQCRRQSLKVRRNSNKYISLAQAVLKFQNKTPDRFHTKSIKKQNECKSVTKSEDNQSKLKSVKQVSSTTLHQVPLNKNIASKESKLITTPRVSVVNNKSRRSCIVTSTKKPSNNTIVPNTDGNVKSRRSCFITPIGKVSNVKNVHSTVEGAISRRSCMINSTKKILNDKDTPSTVGGGTISRRSCLSVPIKKESQNKNLLSSAKVDSRRSYLNTSTRKQPQNKNVISTLVNSNSSEIIFKKEKILFFDIPTNSKQREVTRPIPFSFERREKLKEQFKLNMTKCKDNTSQTKLSLPGCSKSIKHNTSVNVQNKTLLKSDEKLIKQKDDKQYDIINQETSVNVEDKMLLKSDEKSIKQEDDKQCDINVSTMTSELNLDEKKNVKSKISRIGMNSYERAKQRHEFDEKIKQKLAMQEKQREQEKAEKLAKEKLQAAALRKQAEIKAKPMPVYKPLLRIKSAKPLTVPHSPDWAHKNNKKGNS